MQEIVEAYLSRHGITYRAFEHPAVYSCEELAAHHIPGLSTKNLFLRDQKKRRYLLVVLPAAQNTDLVKLAAQVGDKKLSFVNPETLILKLGVYPGAVSPFGLLNNTECDVELWIDEEVMQAPVVHFHPNRNTASLEMSRDDFRRYLDTLKNTITILT